MKNMIRILSCSLLIVMSLSVQAFAADMDRLLPCEIGTFPYKHIGSFLERKVPMWQGLGEEQFIELGLSHLGLSANESSLQIRADLAKLYQKLKPDEQKKEELIVEKDTQQKPSAPIVNEKVKREKEQRPGMVGRWLIPDVGVDVAAFASSTQATADAKDSACYFPFGDMIVVGDHWNQGFEAIKRCVVGTKAYLDIGAELKEYVCVASFTGHNQVTEMTDDKYKSLNYGANTGGITCYTCNGNWRDIWIVFFQPVL